MGSRSSNNLLHETETLWGRTHVALSPKKNLSCTTAFQQPHLDARFHKDSQTLNAENKRQMVHSEVREQTGTSCTAQCAASFRRWKSARGRPSTPEGIASPRRKRCAARCAAGYTSKSTASLRAGCAAGLS